MASGKVQRSTDQIILHSNVDAADVGLKKTRNAYSQVTEQLNPIMPLNSGEVSSRVTTATADGVPQSLEAGLKNQESTRTRAGFTLGTSSINNDRPFKVVVIGAGFSGILAAIRLSQRMKNIDLTVYEKNAGIGGTWFSSRYPGLACDVPAHVYQYSFEAKTDWTEFYSPGPEIRTDMERVVDKYKLMRYIRLNHELIHAQYDESAGKWHLKIRRPKSGSPHHIPEYEIIEDTVDFVLAAVGCLSRWSWPDIEGIKDYKGRLIHTAEWETDESGLLHSSIAGWGDMTVGVIGSGSSAAQVVPGIQPHVKHLYNYVRGRVWLAPTFVGDKMREILQHNESIENYVFTEADKQKLKNPEFFEQFRHELAHNLNSMHLLTIKGTEMHANAQREFKQYMIAKLQKKPWIADHLIPDFPVTCRRLIPGPSYLESLQEDNVDFVPTHIKRITETGIELVDGTRHDLDTIICSTGYDASYHYPFPIIGRGGISLKNRFTPYPETYISLCVDGFPNLFITAGPNSVVTGSLLVILERQVDYIAEVAKKMQREHLKSIEPKKDAVRDFDDYLEEYFKTTAFSERCPSWYKSSKDEGRITGLWPGSVLHAREAFTYPRWEDYDYEFLDSVPGADKPNRLYWLGDGSTYNEKHMTGDRASYLNPGEIDYPPIPV